MTELAGKSFVALLIAVLLLTSTVPALAARQTRFSMSGIEGGQAILTFAADPLITMTPIPFHLILTDLSGSPIPDAKVRCELTMPAMAMPENRPAIKETDGAYWGEALFTMAGEWRSEFHVAMPDGRLEILVFDIERVLLK